jgi:lysophospholipase L1-like esterase
MPLTGLLYAAALAAQPGVTGSADCLTQTLCGAEALAPAMARLQGARQGEQVHILQIGDSHTAGDMITHGLRTRLQARFGNGGRGVLAAGRPYAGYLTFGVTAAETPGWVSNVIFGNRWNESGPALGLSGFTRTSRAEGESLSLATDSPDYNFDRATVCALTEPDAGRIAVRIGDHVETWSLRSTNSGVACRTVESLHAVASAAIVTLDDAPVSITSFGTFRSSGGVVMSNVGVVGAQLQHFGRTDEQVLAEELRTYRPDMIVLAYGTNEGFSARGDLAAYEATLRAQVARLRRHLPRVPILLVGAPDAATRSGSLAGSGCGGGWGTPGFLGQVRAAQRRIARELGLAFWDWERAMGGRCASQAWLSQGLMRGDMVHFTRTGGDRIAELMFADLARIPAAPAFQHPDQPLPVRRRP